MRRQLTTREWMLLALLGIILLIGGYILLYYNPTTTERDRCISETEACRQQIEAAQVRLEDKRRMERELDELFAVNPDPLSIPDYDNIKPVMFELNTILARTLNYTLSFSTVDATQTIIRRQISMSFTTGTYESAKEVLQQLHDSEYRCMLDGVSIDLGTHWNRGFWNSLWDEYWEEDYNGTVSVSGTIVFFEYQKEPKTA